MEHLASRRNLWYMISLIVILPGVLSLIVFRLNPGIDFTGGAIWDIEFQQDITTEQVSAVLADNGYPEADVQLASNAEGVANRVAVIRLKELQEGSPEKALLQGQLQARVGPFDANKTQLTSVGSSVSADITRRAITAVAIASLGILAYIAFAFRKTNRPGAYATCAIVAMLHDVLFVLGVFSILGEFFDIEIDALFVTALLTVIGFSVHDTIVVFDRIRENELRRVSSSLEEVVNYSLAQTIVRSVNTSLTVIFTLLALVLFGGESTRNFVLALLLGVLSGTYSSVFNASQLLVSWEKGEVQRLFGRFRGQSRPQVAPVR